MPRKPIFARKPLTTLEKIKLEEKTKMLKEKQKKESEALRTKLQRERDIINDLLANGWNIEKTATKFHVVADYVGRLVIEYKKKMRKV